jgi:hypothetical protein
MLKLPRPLLEPPPQVSQPLLELVPAWAPLRLLRRWPRALQYLHPLCEIATARRQGT